MCTSLSCCFSFFLIWQHFMTFTNPDAQSKVCDVVMCNDKYVFWLLGVVLGWYIEV